MLFKPFRKMEIVSTTKYQGEPKLDNAGEVHNAGKVLNPAQVYNRLLVLV